MGEAREAARAAAVAARASKSKRAAMEPKASARGAKVKATIVWCHERCYKGELEEVRRQFASTAETVGCTLTCFKKAPTFATWVSRPSTLPYILLTDNRELKPCQTFLKEAQPEAQPFLSIVLVQDPKFLGKVSKFVEKGYRHASSTIIAQSPEEVCAAIEQAMSGSASMCTVASSCSGTARSWGQRGRARCLCILG
mmetsp:Transcript_36806/g.78139  ORF Transcript_36806/g.78139 Transcript_36806/m.78139 type:complete len:197 (-) Transcript_36806:557-1147(-)